MNIERLIEGFYAKLSELYTLQCVQGLAAWDQQVCMPELAAAGRAAQMELLSRLIHQRLTAPELTATVNDLFTAQDRLSADDLVNVREMKRQLDRQSKLPEAFVAERARVTALSYAAWTKAKPASDFQMMKSWSRQIFDLCRKEAEYVGYDAHPYDALLEIYEPYARFAVVKPLLLDLGTKLRSVIPALIERTAAVTPLENGFSESDRFALCRRVLEAVGYDFQRGRHDKTAHPFESALGENDVRITTRLVEKDFLSMLLTALHEGGHAIYEQNLPSRWRGTPLGSAVSLGIHESQSRFLENTIGRSRPFAAFLAKVLREYAPGGRTQFGAEEIWGTLNKVQPSLVRVEADEVTYSVHVVIRMTLEEQIVAGEMDVDDLPSAWNELYRKYLDIDPPNDREGVLQDVHWYSGMVGYFPTYALGNIFGAMFLEKMQQELPDLSSLIEQGDFRLPIDYLRTKIHLQGMRYSSFELVKRVCGTEANVEPFISYLKGKFGIGTAASSVGRG